MHSPHKRIPATSCSPDISSILCEFVRPGNVSILRHTTDCVGFINPFKYEAQTALFKDPVRTAQ